MASLESHLGDAGVTEQLEGLMSLSFEYSRVNEEERVVYVEYIATAPWNRRVEAPKLRGVGRLLIQAAIRTSVELGLNGRIGLHAKPAVEAFYRDKLRLVDLGTEVVEDGKWVYFEATPAVARRIL